jgi:hypothetical protein
MERPKDRGKREFPGQRRDQRPRREPTAPGSNQPVEEPPREDEE